MAAVSVPVVRTISELRRQLQVWRSEGESIGLVPTMGALHTGHRSLIRRSLAYTTRTCVTLFVNPTQFGPREDFSTYPRDEASDVRAVAEEGAHLLYAPSVEEMYPTGAATRVTVPGIGDILEGEFRPGFFTGVATVVAKLLIQAMPDAAIFGEKDYQQLLVVRRMAADLDLPVKIEGSRTMREADGLALSSRNAYLSTEERQVAPVLYATLSQVARDLSVGAPPEARCAEATETLQRAGFGLVNYITARDANTLAPWTGNAQTGRVLAAAWLGRTRLIDNVPIPLPPQ